MNHKRFWGRDMNEALRALRRSLGPDALIAETKNLTKDLGGGVEITALAEGETHDETDTIEVPPVVKAASQPVEELREELALLKSMLGWLAPALGQQDKLIKSLVTHGVTPENISKLLHAMENAPAGDAHLRWRHAMATLLPGVSAIGTTAGSLALIGPSGVGKTSALIKLTLFESRRRECRVGWVSMDERRLNAADPLMAYSGILGVRFERAATRGELKLALGQLSDCDLILIDTPGTNPRDAVSIAQLAKSLHGIGGLRSMLLLSAVTNGPDLADWVNNYRTVGLHSLLFTKLDECRYLGPLLNTALGAAVPLSYITFGQSFAEDLALATPEVFASLLLTGVVNE
jgi:flagellar biosynthesis protein FlhF